MSGTTTATAPPATPERGVEHWRTLHRGNAYFSGHGRYKDRLHRLGIDRIVAMLDPGPDDVLLDLGCGYGRALYHLLPLVKRAIGVELAPEPLAEARGLLAGRGEVDLIQNDGTTLAPIADASVDAAFAFTVFQHVTRPGVEGYLKELARAVRPGGRVLFQLLAARDEASVQADIADEPREQSLAYTPVQAATLTAAAGLRLDRLERGDSTSPDWEWLWVLAGVPGDGRGR